MRNDLEVNLRSQREHDVLACPFCNIALLQLAAEESKEARRRKLIFCGCGSYCNLMQGRAGSD
jgi:uncharacterized protein YbaR (Trm112 family)